MSALKGTTRGRVDDGIVLIKGMSPEDDRGYIVLRYFDDGSYGNRVTPSAGTAVVQAAANEGGPFIDIVNGTLLASELKPATPNWRGPSSQVQLEFTVPIVAATHFILDVYKYQAD